jgi:hypothetical protein
MAPNNYLGGQLPTNCVKKGRYRSGRSDMFLISLEPDLGFVA